MMHRVAKVQMILFLVAQLLHLFMQSLVVVMPLFLPMIKLNLAHEYIYPFLSLFLA